VSVLITILYLIAAVLAAAFAAAEVRMLLRFLMNRTAIRATMQPHRAAKADAAVRPPTVTIQLPMFNERLSARQVILAAAAQDYDKERFDIQVLDDSTDDTQEIVAAVVAELKAKGIRIENIHRKNRAGYKAGALAAGLTKSSSEFVAVFDADFSPPPNFLRRVMVDEDAFREPKVAFVQTRWGFDRSDSGLFHSAMALLLDRHFYIQKPTRAFAGQVMTFNGSGGVWRRAAIDAAGGWTSDTLTEDLDLSYRCALAGWTGRYVHDISVPNELPEEMRAFKLQQRRWARGNAQCLRKLLGNVLDTGNRLRDRWEEAFLLAGYSIHPILFTNLLLWPWAVLYMDRSVFWAMQALMSVALLVAPFSFLLTLAERGDSLKVSSLAHALAGIGIGIGLMVNNSVAQIQGLVLNEGEFARTPKGWQSDRADRADVLPAYASPLHWTFALELAVIGYCLWSTALLVSRGESLWAVAMLFWGLCIGLVAALQVRPRR
jgi:cellulose synthase/poly-beta-1,6-N-acetylglucosamine synthase-like glycosyltransferase